MTYVKLKLHLYCGNVCRSKLNLGPALGVWEQKQYLVK